MRASIEYQGMVSEFHEPTILTHLHNGDKLEAVEELAA
jgi:hypothetical protein